MYRLRPVFKRGPRVDAFLAGFACTGVLVYFFSGDWVCSAAGLGFLGGVLTGFLNWLGKKWYGRASRVKTGGAKWGYSQRTAVVLLVALALLGMELLPGIGVRDSAFQAAFHLSPPSGVADLHAERHFAGGPGDRMSLLHFYATRQAIEKLVAARSLSRDNSLTDDYSYHIIDWPTFWRSSGFSHGGDFRSSWKNPVPMQQPELYLWSNFAGGLTLHGKTESVRLLWDAASGEAFGIYAE